MIIKSLHIKNFKKFQNLTIDLQTLDCLVGGNNSGKSTILQALALFDFCLHQCLSKTNGNPITLKKRTITEDDFVILPVTKSIDLWYDRILNTDNNHVLIAITVFFDNEKQVKTTLELNFNRFIIETETDLDEKWLTDLQKFKIAYLPVFSTFQIKEEKRTQLAVKNELGRGNVNIVMRNLLLALKEANREQELIDLMQRAFPNIEKMSIEFDEASMQFISVTYLEKGKKKEFDISSAGSGFQQFIYIFGFILLEKPNIILLDEPDKHLHGQLQKALLYELERLIKNEKQVFLATHSRDLITAVLPENIIHLYDGNAERLELDYQVFNALETLGSMENTQLVVLQEYKRVIVVENKDDWDIIQHFCKLILGETQMQEVCKRFAVCFAYGNPYKQDMPRFRKSLQDIFTKKAGKSVKMFVIADRDYFPYPEELINDLQKKELNFNKSAENHITWHIWQRNEIENYLIDISVLMRLIKPKPQAQISIDEQLFRHKYTQLIDEQKDNVEARFMKGFEEYSKYFQKGWDSTTWLSKAKETLKNEWQNATYWIDAKKITPNIIGWLQQNQYQQFSDKKILEVLTKDDLSPEIHELVRQLSNF